MPHGPILILKVSRPFLLSLMFPASGSVGPYLVDSRRTGDMGSHRDVRHCSRELRADVATMTTRA